MSGFSCLALAMSRSRSSERSAAYCCMHASTAIKSSRRCMQMVSQALDMPKVLPQRFSGGTHGCLT